MRIRKNSSKVLGSHCTHYWFIQPSSNSSENSIAEPPPPSNPPMICQLNLSPWDVLDFASEEMSDPIHHVNEDPETSDIMETGKKAGEEEPTFDMESGNSSLRASKMIQKKKNKKEKKDEEEKKNLEGMEGDDLMTPQRGKRRNSGSRMKTASDFYYFSTSGSWWGRMRKGPKRSHLESCTREEGKKSSKLSETSRGKEKEEDEMSVDGDGGDDDE